MFKSLTWRDLELDLDLKTKTIKWYVFLTWLDKAWDLIYLKLKTGLLDSRHNGLNSCKTWDLKAET